MMLKKATGLIALCIGLSGCGNEFEGSYRAMDGVLGPVIAIEVKGDKANVVKVDPFRKVILSDQIWEAEEKGEKLLLTDLRGKTFAFKRAVDEKGLDCLNCGLMPDSWQRFDPNK
ncbi:hypothetical protein [Pseudomonas rubra]|uniref:Lipoprotein n=1 Tax=Pseudomonas rubra TaxID=2942627 RepID=A0ABT5PF65_9PSED|nr:hypothetical protein [Pseudomonas rubra]MDD1016955.1 hypothetical protein [Pseudomonas rubra]MDD1041048.1 hypothetical protein [Pseudomonas rubra]MDD1157475.1 hypothetical protein [Pseudomonas rubra]